MGRKKKKQKVEETYINKVTCYYCLNEYVGFAAARGIFFASAS